MKKLIILIVLVLVSVSSYAQYENPYHINRIIISKWNSDLLTYEIKNISKCSASVRFIANNGKTTITIKDEGEQVYFTYGEAVHGYDGLMQVNTYHCRDDKGSLCTASFHMYDGKTHFLITYDQNIRYTYCISNAQQKN